MGVNPFWLLAYLSNKLVNAVHTSLLQSTLNHYLLCIKLRQFWKCRTFMYNYAMGLDILWRSMYSYFYNHAVFSRHLLELFYKQIFPPEKLRSGGSWASRISKNWTTYLGTFFYVERNMIQFYNFNDSYFFWNGKCFYKNATKFCKLQPLRLIDWENCQIFF